jgi:hypothetical protein
MVINGVVIDAAALAAGGIMATRAQMVTDLLLKQQPDKFMCKTGRLKPGKRYLVVRGGLADGSVTIDNIPERDFRKIQVTAWKKPLQDDPTSANVQYVLENQGENSESSRIMAAEVS